MIYYQKFCPILCVLYILKACVRTWVYEFHNNKEEENKSNMRFDDLPAFEMCQMNWTGGTDPDFLFLEYKIFGINIQQS